MALTAEDVLALNKLNAVFTKIENEADNLNVTPDELFDRYKVYNVAGVGNFDQDVPSIGVERANVFANATSAKQAQKVTK